MVPFLMLWLGPKSSGDWCSSGVGGLFCSGFSCRFAGVGGTCGEGSVRSVCGGDGWFLVAC